MAPLTYRINEKVCYMVSELMEHHIAPAFFKGCQRQPRRCIRKHSIPESEYTFASRRNHGWKVYPDTYKQAKLFLSANYVEQVAVSFKPKDKQISSEKVQNVFSKCVGAFPCVYLFSLSDAKHFEFVDTNETDSMLYKFGKTNNLSRRTGEHMKLYGAMDHVDMSLECFTYVDPSYIGQAESKIKSYFKMANMLIPHEAHNELVVIPNDKLPLVKSMYADVSELFSYKNTELVYRMRELEQLVEKKDDDSGVLEKQKVD